MISFFEKIRDIWETYSVGVAILAIIGIIVGGFALGFIINCFQAWLVMLLWNWVAVELFGLPTIGFWMSFGLCWLCSLLFKSKISFKKSED